MLTSGDADREIRLMNESSWQKEKKKIIARLSVAIYKMTDEQLISLLHFFKDFKLKEDEKLLNIRPVTSEGATGFHDRQMLIARFFLLIHQLSESELLKFMNRYEQKQFAMLREYPRVSCNFTIDLAADGRAINCFAMDISAGGIFVESCEPLTMGQSVSICFSLDDESLPLKMNGRVVRLEQGGVGIKYEALTPYQLEILKNLIDRLNEQEEY
jgi:hypothetical protein